MQETPVMDTQGLERPVTIKKPAVKNRDLRLVFSNEAAVDVGVVGEWHG